jgi:hypothetical protein
MAFTEDIGEFFEVDQGFADLANITRERGLDLPGVSVLVDRDVDVVADNGFGITKRTVLTFRADQLMDGSTRVFLDEGDEVEVGSECFTLLHAVSDDGSVVVWYAR